MLIIRFESEIFLNGKWQKRSEHLDLQKAIATASSLQPKIVGRVREIVVSDSIVWQSMTPEEVPVDR